MGCYSGVQLALLTSWQVCNTASDGQTNHSTIASRQALLTTTGAVSNMENCIYDQGRQDLSLWTYCTKSPQRQCDSWLDYKASGEVLIVSFKGHDRNLQGKKKL